MVQDMEVGMKISITRPCSIVEILLMLVREVDLGLGPELLPSIIQVIILDHQVLIGMVITEVDIYITAANSLHITMVD